MKTSTTKSRSKPADISYRAAKTAAIWGAGVSRWHANRWPALRMSGDTTDAHQGRCVRLLVCLHPYPSAALLAAAACHDVQECITGDTPGPAKVGALGQALNRREEEVAVELGLPMVTGENATWLKLVDQIDTLLWTRLVEPRTLNNPDWIAVAQRIMNAAEDLGCDEAVAALLNTVEI